MKLLYITILSSFLGGCITVDEMKSKIISNNTNEIKKEEVKEVKEVKNNFNKSVINKKNKGAKIQFVHWKCFEHFGAGAKQILTVGYFPKFTEKMSKDKNLGKETKKFSKRFLQSGIELGMMDFKSTSKQFLAVYELEGVRHSFKWGGNKFNDYIITIVPSGRGYFWNFEGAKQGETRKSSETFDCKSAYPETTWLFRDDIKIQPEHLFNYIR